MQTSGILSPYFAKATKGFAGACHTKLIAMQSVVWGLILLLKKRIAAAAAIVPEIEQREIVGVFTFFQFYLVIALSTTSISLYAKNDLFTIMIDPAGDAKH